MNMIARASVLIFFVALANISFASQNADEKCDKQSNVIKSFIQNPTDEGWDNLSELAESPQATSCDCSADVLVYHATRLKRDLPNSHSLVGITPNQYIAMQQHLLADATKRLRSCNSANLPLLVEKMKQQNFDPEVARTAKELEKKLKR